MNDVHCEIQTRALPQGIELVGVVWSDTVVSGSYRFIVNKEGPAGSSQVMQSGLFSLEDNKPQIVGTVSLNTTGGDRYVVRLTISDDHRTLCTASLG